MKKMKSQKIIRVIGILFIFGFLIISIIMMLPDFSTKKTQVHQRLLEKKVTRSGNTTRTDYCDDNGVITIAADLGYATVVTTKTDNKETAHYYDDKGEPVALYPGYYAIVREYDQNGRNNHVTYLGIDDLPVITAEGYSDIIWTYYNSGKIKTEKYYNTSGNPTNTHTYGYGYINDYNEKGQNIKTTYLDEQDNPMLVDLGYATVQREFVVSNDNHKIIKEMYFDEADNPVLLSMGHSGLQKEYDEEGRIAVLTYLDSKGNPTKTEKGYTTISRTFYADNSVATERYFDLEGNPFSLAEGQYGIKKKDESIIYLDANGDESFNLKRLLYNQNWIIIPSAILLVILSLLVTKKSNCVLLLVYIMIVLYITLMFRDKNKDASISFFASYNPFFVNREARIEILRNIWLFIPLGAIISQLLDKPTIMIFPVAFSMLIEILQYHLKLGYCDPGDIISNFVGSLMGYMIVRTNRSLKKQNSLYSRIKIFFIRR